MPSNRISIHQNQGVYFLTFTIERWYYLFDRHNRWQILADALSFAQARRHLKLHGYVFMLNHVHLLVSSPDMIAFVRDFKRHTSKEFKKNIQQHEANVLELFIESSGSYHFWQKTNAPKVIESENFFRQKLNYIHNNPVKKQYVTQGEHWKWSSANPNSSLIIDRVL